MRKDAAVNINMTHVMVHGVPLLNMASSSDETIPLPYCSAPINAEAEPAIWGTSSNAAAVADAATIPFMEKNMNTIPIMIYIPPKSALTNTVSVMIAIRETLVANFNNRCRD